MAALSLTIISFPFVVQIEEFRPRIPGIIALSNRGLKNRHWQEISAILGVGPLSFSHFFPFRLVGAHLFLLRDGGEETMFCCI